MLCGCAAAVSDRVGAGHDLISTAVNGFTFPYGDVNALAATLRDALSDPHRLRRMGEDARTRMGTWSPAQNIQTLVQAIDQTYILAERQQSPA
jgi:glycosyltransferase involved in cell wall biosynthesis